MISPEIVLTIVTIALLSSAYAYVSDKNEDSLVLVHVLFRHGERTPDEASSVYRTDPHKDYNYYPYGKGQLTNKGKQTEYRMGTELRRRYGKFLGDHYIPDIIDASSSDYNRTKMSLQLVLASLFPPAEKEAWEPSLHWQPVPYNYNHRDRDPLLFPINCPNFARYTNEYKLSAEYKAAEEKYSALMAFLTAHTGAKYSNFFQLYFVTGVFLIQKEWGLTSPKFVDEIFPYPMLNATMEFYRQTTATVNLRKLMCGSLLEKIVMDTTAKLYDDKSGKNKKLVLYSAHEYNLAAMLHTLDVFIPEVPPYASYIAFEVHNVSNVYTVKVLYENYSKAEPIQLKLPTCDIECPYEDFVDITKKYFPDPNECGCFGC